MIICLDANDTKLSLTIAKLSGELLASYEHTAINSRKGGSEELLDLTARAETANKVKADFFISLDCQASSNDAAVKEILLYHSPEQQALSLAVAINNELARMGLSGKHNIKRVDFDLPALDMPAVFIKCSPDAIALPHQQRHLAAAILMGIVNCVK